MKKTRYQQYQHGARKTNPVSIDTWHTPQALVVANSPGLSTVNLAAASANKTLSGPNNSSLVSQRQLVKLRGSTTRNLMRDQLKTGPIITPHESTILDVQKSGEYSPPMTPPGQRMESTINSKQLRDKFHSGKQDQFSPLKANPSQKKPVLSKIAS